MPDQVKRLLVAVVIFLALFLFLRFLLIPDSFGKLGHYRADAIDDNASLPLRHAGKEACKTCHDDVIDELSNGFHGDLACEGCHGPAYQHAILSDQVDPDHYPDSLRLKKPTERESCARCHDLNAARIKILPDSTDKSAVKMVDVTEHNHFVWEETNDVIRCVECHYPHSP